MRKTGIDPEVQEKILKKYNAKNKPLKVSNGTWKNVSVHNLRKKYREEKLEYHRQLFVKVQRRLRWLSLKKELGEEYLNDLRKQCYYMIAA